MEDYDDVVFFWATSVYGKRKQEKLCMDKAADEAIKCLIYIFYVFRNKEAPVECLKEKKLFKDTAAKVKADIEKAFESDNGEVGDKSHLVTAQEREAITLTRSQVIYLFYH